ncbi:hypothetical protein Ancab_006409 [Ancistrocladus abbreviatus]
MGQCGFVAFWCLQASWTKIVLDVKSCADGLYHALDVYQIFLGYTLGFSRDIVEVTRSADM